jgi:hypothetical protein
MTEDESIVSRYTARAELAGVAGPNARNAFEVLGETTVTLEDLSYRLNTYIGDVPGVARGQAELALEDSLQHPEVERLLDNMDRLTEALILALHPDTLDGMLKETFSEIHRQRDEVMKDLEEQRIGAFEQIAAERIAIVQALAAEREVISRQLRRARLETMDSGERIVKESMGQAKSDAMDLVDHLFLRLAQLTGALLIGLALVVLTAAAILRGRPWAGQR